MRRELSPLPKNPSPGESESQIAFGSTSRECLWNVVDARTQIRYCHLTWRGRTPNGVEILPRLGDTSHKPEWYRGDMRNWPMPGLTTARPSGQA